MKRLKKEDRRSSILLLAAGGIATFTANWLHESTHIHLAWLLAGTVAVGFLVSIGFALLRLSPKRQQHFFHRDLEPGNIVLQSNDEKSVVRITEGDVIISVKTKQGTVFVSRPILKKPSGSRLTPEKVCNLFSFMMPKYCRQRYLEPFLEEMKEERLRALAVAETKWQERIIEFCFYVKLAGTYLVVFSCLLRDGLAKVSPWVRWFFFGTGKGT